MARKVLRFIVVDLLIVVPTMVAVILPLFLVWAVGMIVWYLSFRAMEMVFNFLVRIDGFILNGKKEGD